MSDAQIITGTELPPIPMAECRRCNGTKVVVPEGVDAAHDDVFQTCLHCKGTGKMTEPPHRCPWCLSAFTEHKHTAGPGNNVCWWVTYKCGGRYMRYNVKGHSAVSPCTAMTNEDAGPIRDIAAERNVTLLDLISGTQCDPCRGNGYVWVRNLFSQEVVSVRCSDCNGMGQILEDDVRVMLALPRQPNRAD